jgi:two-component system, chemotaxis family, chemotaxis protein CheY
MKILIVDDSEMVRTQVKQAIEGEGFQAIEAVNGVDGLNKLQGNPDLKLIICDVNMPEMDGLTMCSKVREKDQFKEIPIFMLTTESSPDMKKQGKEAGVKAWMTKPFNPEKMVAAIKKVVGG